MNIHVRKNHLYTQAENSQILAYVLDGKSIGAIGRELGPVLGRSYEAVRHRASALLRSVRHVEPSEPLPTRLIPKPDLPAFYAIGWRVVDYSAESVAIEWAHGVDAREPVLNQRP